MFYEIGISSHHAGFGMFEVDEANGDGWSHEQDLIDEITQNVYELIELGGSALLPPDVEDIRGRIYHEPDRVFAVRNEDGSIQYLGIVERD